MSAGDAAGDGQREDPRYGGLGPGPLAILDKVRKPRPAARPGERCDMCGVDIADEHSHVVNLDDRALMCTCRPCRLLFSHEGAARGRFRAVPERWAKLADFRLSAGQWESLQVPVSVAFFFENSTNDQVAAFYPSPAGATESLLALDTWTEIASANPELSTLTPDVEALLVRVGADREAEGYIVPIDACYELVGLLRKHWKGFDGGTEAHAALDDFFARARERASPTRR